jgi:2-polyprenyl-6-methoxyphenol hydroxylase-like FAD-dependent oxidoreductase
MGSSDLSPATFVLVPGWSLFLRDGNSVFWDKCRAMKGREHMLAQPAMIPPELRSHAIVIGASMAGLLTARVLADHFKQVTIIERDALPIQSETRKGVPQGQHAHILLMQGEMILKELFPDLYEAFTQAGAIAFSSDDLRWYSFGVWKLTPAEPVQVYGSTRPLLEQHVRRCLTARSNVRLIERCEVKRLCVSEGGDKITGVSFKYLDYEAREEELSAALVVDASGRGSHMPQWLATLGYGTVEVENINVAVGYATRIYRCPPDPKRSWKMLVIYPTPPQEQRLGLIMPIENDQWIVTVMGRLHDYPPTDEAGFLAYARSLAEPGLYEAIKGAEPVTPISLYKFASNQWRHYERLPHFPAGLVILGDAVCSFNPVYGQGMSVAALEAKALDACLRQQPGEPSTTDFSQQFQQAITQIISVPWMMATSEDFRYPATPGKRPFGSRFLRWYTRRINELTGSDLFVAMRFHEVMHLLKPPAALFHPRILWTVLVGRSRKI